MRWQPAFRRAFLEDADAASAYASFLSEVFGLAPRRPADADPAWMPFAFFDEDGLCIAGVEAAALGLVADGRTTAATAIRLAGVVATHRGHGLFRDLMTRALAWCAAQCEGPVLLYTEEPAIYTRFGFRPLAQHAFVGTAPAPMQVRLAEIVDVTGVEQCLAELASRRTPVSNACAMLGARDLLLAGLREDGDLVAAHAADLDALIIHEVDDDTLVLADVVAEDMPTLAQIVGALRSGCGRVRTLFPPDRLAWEGTPEPDDTGLMVRGAVPAAMTRPFMLPPTTAF